MYTDIQTALLTRLQAMSGVLSIAGENMQYQPDEGTPYLETSILFTESQPATIGANGFDEYPGIFQVLAKYPKGSGTKNVNDMSTSIKNQFGRGSNLTSGSTVVHIEKSWVGPIIPDDVWYIRPISIKFYTRIAN